MLCDILDQLLGSLFHEIYVETMRGDDEPHKMPKTGLLDNLRLMRNMGETVSAIDKILYCHIARGGCS